MIKTKILTKYFHASWKTENVCGYVCVKRYIRDTWECKGDFSFSFPRIFNEPNEK